MTVAAPEVDALRHVCAQVESLIHAARVTQLEAMADLVMAEGADEAVGYLQYECAFSRRFAKDFVAAAVALPGLPHIGSAFASGSLTLERLCLLVKFATPECDAELSVSGAKCSLNQLRKQAAEADARRRDPSTPYNERQHLTFSETRSRFRLHGDFPIALGPRIAHAIDRLANAEGLDAVTGEFRPQSARRADALLAICGRETAADDDPDLATVVIHVDLSQLLSPETEFVDVDGHAVLLRDVMDQVCDSRFQLVSERNSQPVGIGRVSRDIPAWLRRLLNKRDQGCRFPNCTNTKGIDGHHIVWWSMFGETNIDNLISLCRRHHRLIHQDGWTIHGDPAGFVEFRDAHGSVFTGRPPVIEEKVRQFVTNALERPGMTYVQSDGIYERSEPTLKASPLWGDTG